MEVPTYVATCIASQYSKNLHVSMKLTTFSKHKDSYLSASCNEHISLSAKRANVFCLATS